MMDYQEKYKTLREAYNLKSEKIIIPEFDLEILNFPFQSEAIIKDENNSFLAPAKRLFNALLSYYLKENKFSHDSLFQSLDETDQKIEENKHFTYSILRKSGTEKSSSFIFLFHGLNERSWEKYLPWATDLIERTGKAVVLFPIAFHMNRAPQIWSDPRLMSEVSKERTKLLPDVHCSSFANAALSTRLQFSPRRFILSGIQTYSDIVNLMQQIRDDQHSAINKNSTVDFFGYSIGAFLSEILMMSNPRTFFSDSRMFLFCGGSTLDLVTPVSRAIIDSEAALSLKNYFVDNCENEFLRDESIIEMLKTFQEEGENLKSMLNHSKMKSFRMDKLNMLKNQTLVMPLLKDKVFTSEGVEKSYGNISNKCVRPFDFNYSYSHENPFPMNEKYKSDINIAFNKTFELAGSFLS